MANVYNPILTGFNPDPSIIRVGEDYYIATSTFEWFPGVQIHHSKDLIHWELVARPLDRVSQLAMKGVPDSCGVWAPCLSYDNGIFYLVYTNVKSFQGPWKDTPNYLVTTKDIMGPWSEPIFLNSSGFDGSLFHEEGGKKWFTSMIVDHRKGRLFGGVIAQEYSTELQRLVGPVHYLTEGTLLGSTEAPHIYQRDGYYYLILAEGGTEYDHAITMMRSRELNGPYEVHPENPILSSRNYPNEELQKAGHGDLFEDGNGNWFIVFLVGRPLTNRGRCILGRESALERIVWRDGWPYIDSGLDYPRKQWQLNSNTDTEPIEQIHEKHHFDIDSLPLPFQSLRVPIDRSWCSLDERRGFLRIYGRESLSSTMEQSMIARRLQHFHVRVITEIDFSPDNLQQLAGLVCYYNTYHYIYFHVSYADKDHRTLQIIVCDKYDTKEILEAPILIPSAGAIRLGLEWNREYVQFMYALDSSENWIRCGPPVDASILSDDYIQDADVRYRPAFTGSFIGMCCQDLSGNRKYADFDYFEYEEL